MSTQEIPHSDWSNFLNTFSLQHEGWLATLEISGDEIGTQQEVQELPFEGVSVAGSEQAETIVISLGKSAEDHISHTINNPAHVSVEQTPAGATTVLQIESEDQSKTLLRFRSPMPPEFVDGVVLD